MVVFFALGAFFGALAGAGLMCLVFLWRGRTLDADPRGRDRLRRSPPSSMMRPPELPEDLPSGLDIESPEGLEYLWAREVMEDLGSHSDEERSEAMQIIEAHGGLKR